MPDSPDRARILLYHWAPRARCGQITSQGLLPGSLSTDETWNPDHICFADSPSLAWALSGATARGRRIESWDLWMTSSDRLGDYSTRAVNETGELEYRTRQEVPPEDLWWVGGRTAAGSMAVALPRDFPPRRYPRLRSV